MIRPIIVTALLGREDQAWAEALRRAHFPPERNFLAAHLTLFHHLPPSLSDELDRRLAEAARGAAPAARLTGLRNLGRGVALAIESDALTKIRTELAHAFAGCLTPQDASGWRPHVTIQNKVAPAEARALLTELAATTEARPIAIAGLASWWYDGGPWEPRSRHAFRG